MPRTINVPMVEDSENDARLLERELARQGFIGASDSASSPLRPGAGGVAAALLLSSGVRRRAAVVAANAAKTKPRSRLPTVHSRHSAPNGAVRVFHVRNNAARGG